MQIELVPHTGFQSIRGVKVEIELDQFRVTDGGRVVAYLGKAPGSPLNFAHYYPASYTQAVAAEVTRIRGESPSKIGVPPDPLLVRRVENSDE